MVRAPRRPGVPRRAWRPAYRLRRPAVPTHVRFAAFRRDRVPRLLETGGREPHGCTQDQQHDGAGAAREATRQAPCDRRDRCRSARCGDRDRRGAVRLAVRRVHGRGGHTSSSAERRQDAAPRHGGGTGDGGAADPEGSDQRGDARLGRNGNRDPLRVRHRGRATPVPIARARSAARDRRRSTRAVPSRRGPRPRHGRRLRGRWEQRDRHVHRVHRCSRRDARRRRGRRSRRRHRGSLPLAHAR